jgi:hypothetical protein
MSSWARLLFYVSPVRPWTCQRGAYSVFSGLECGGGAMLGSRGSGIQAAWVAGGFESERATQRGLEKCWLAGVARRRCPVAAKRWWAVTKRVARLGSRDHRRPKQAAHLHCAASARCIQIESHTDARTACTTSTTYRPPVAARRAEQLAVLRIVVGGEESQIGAIPHWASKRCPSH